MATLSLKDVRKTYGKTDVIHGVSIDIADGEFVVIVGPSGCGKSTLLRMVAGLEEITSGTIEIGGRVVNTLEPRARDIAMVFQNYALYPHMSVFDNMAYGLRIAGVRGDDLKARVAKAAEMLDLSTLLDRKPRQLSGGQRQRVAMGRALVRDPAAFLFDEPLSNLDAKLRVSMRLQIKDLQRRVATTSLYVTHDQVEAMTLADRLIVMNKGVAEQIATPMEIYDAPANMFVAGFIGSPAMNFLPATVTGSDLLISDGSRMPRPAGLQDGGVILGVRPEHLTRSRSAGPGTLTVRVLAVETLGADAFVHARLGESGSEDIVFRVPGHDRPAEGTVVSLAVDQDKVHIFDAATQRRISGM
ncbi:sn-glycerol-3-phosphate import ATP-binding protein UgpC [Frigidibacter sp. RF13]|uniref:sn-glycerol-3-phosphate import ATP-binding protein UgpC n=1 Tax=Frigidibacter sp. RF13 TaxID=2997340 RepID=UPI0022707E72|nr:sn-glycerol-3-phosphate import ATP-binding protein UgpC [Frigidibacter sp. RF13]MCY1128574.1 sn-glycerol-3-phosphate import ATP-binding protein UgpC [Frigidibacter sp. RF13]